MDTPNAKTVVDGVISSGPFAGARVRSVLRQDGEVRSGVEPIQTDVFGVFGSQLYDGHHGTFAELFLDWFARLPGTQEGKAGGDETV